MTPAKLKRHLATYISHLTKKGAEYLHGLLEYKNKSSFCLKMPYFVKRFRKEVSEQQMY